jgi:hypothetical protein
VNDSQQAKTQWLARVLDIGAAPPADIATAQGFTKRLAALMPAVKWALASEHPHASDIRLKVSEAGVCARKQAYAQANALLDEVDSLIGPAGAAAASGAAGDDQEIALARSAARAREDGPEAGRGVVYKKLLLRWREAQRTFDANLAAFGTNLLSRQEIKEHPRIEDIKRGVALLPALVPTFGGSLEDVLDAGMSAADATQRAKLDAAGIAAIDAYRQQLAAASHLLALEAFAAKKLGANLALHRALDDVLLELKQQLAA